VFIFIQAMKIKKLLTSLFFSLVCASIALLLNACGPGTGGTGTGPANGSGSEPVTNPPVVTTPPVVVIPPVVTNPVTVIAYAEIGGSSQVSVLPENPTMPPVSLNGLWESEDKQSQAYFDDRGIVFRKGCFYYEYVGEWRADTELNSDRTVFAKAEGYIWRVRFSNGKLAFSVKNASGTVFLEADSLTKAPLPHLKPIPSLVCNG
jgi:hypothetical protein